MKPVAIARTAIKALRDPVDLDQHIMGTYLSLRIAMALLAFLLPVLLFYGGTHQLWWISDVLPGQNSLSAYYHAAPHAIPGKCEHHAGVYRDLFVGILAAISLSLVAYKGYGKLENWLLNLSGFCLACVAFFPMAWPEEGVKGCKDPFPGSMLLGNPNLSIHFVAAGFFFLLLMFVVWFTSKNTLKLVQEIPNREGRQISSRLANKIQFWRKVYNVCGWLIPGPFVIGLLGWIYGKQLHWNRFVLHAEWVGIWVFAAYWLLKTLEIKSIKTDSLLIER
jgi:hypothetical protein